MDLGNENRPPRGALAVVAVGLIACVAAWLLSTDELGGAWWRSSGRRAARCPTLGEHGSPAAAR